MNPWHILFPKHCCKFSHELWKKQFKNKQKMENLFKLNIEGKKYLSLTDSASCPTYERQNVKQKNP